MYACPNFLNYQELVIFLVPQRLLISLQTNVTWPCKTRNCSVLHLSDREIENNAVSIFDTASAAVAANAETTATTVIDGGEKFYRAHQPVGPIKLH